MNSKTFPKNVMVYFPIINLSSDPDVINGKSPFDIHFENLTTYNTPNNLDFIKLVSWDFGDGSPVYNQNIVNHTFLTAGTYTVKLNIQTYQGCNIETTKEAIINQ